MWVLRGFGVWVHATAVRLGPLQQVSLAVALLCAASLMDGFANSASELLLHVGSRGAEQAASDRDPGQDPGCSFLLL